MKLLKIVIICAFFFGFVKANGQDSLRVKINTINGIIQTDKNTMLDLRFAGVDQRLYDELVKKVSNQKDFNIYKKGFNSEYTMAQLRLKSDEPKTTDQVEKFIDGLGFNKIIVDSKEIKVSSLSEVYQLKQERIHPTNSVIKSNK